jgi:hypothetical protein
MWCAVELGDEAHHADLILVVQELGVEAHRADLILVVQELGGETHHDWLCRN